MCYMFVVIICNCCIYSLLHFPKKKACMIKMKPHIWSCFNSLIYNYPILIEKKLTQDRYVHTLAWNKEKRNRKIKVTQNPSNPLWLLLMVAKSVLSELGDFYSTINFRIQLYLSHISNRITTFQVQKLTFISNISAVMVSLVFMLTQRA